MAQLSLTGQVATERFFVLYSFLRRFAIDAWREWITSVEISQERRESVVVTRYEQLVRRVESDEALSAVLSSALRLARDRDDHRLAVWIELELLGYKAGTPSMTNDVVVPEYRTISGQWFDAFGRRFVVTDPRIAFVNETRLREGVTELERYATVQGDLALPLPEFAEILKRELHVDVYWFRYTPTAIPPILARIRSQLVQRLVDSGSQLEGAETQRAPARNEDVVEIRPNFYGIGINVRALVRRWRSASGEK